MTTIAAKQQSNPPWWKPSCDATIVLSLGDVELCLTSKSPAAGDDSVSISKNSDGEVLIDLNNFVGTLRIKDKDPKTGAASSEGACLDGTESNKKRRAADASKKLPNAKRTKKDHTNHLEDKTLVGDGLEVGIVGGSETPQKQKPPPKLVACLNLSPETLHELWAEYQFDINGRKAAKDFTEAERGAVKHFYNRREIFWSKCEEMIHSGMSTYEVIRTIYETYAPTTDIKEILTKMRIDKNKGWPSLLRKTKAYAAAAAEEEGSPDNFTRSIKKLHKLWLQYQFGDSNEGEQGVDEEMHNLRMVFWSKCDEMVFDGMSLDEAIRTICQTYKPARTIRNLLTKMKSDKKKGWPSLLRKTMAEPADAVAEEEGFPATLSHSPKDLLMLWEEYICGIDGRKPAKYFTLRERNTHQRMKQNFYRRKTIWNVMEKQIGAGLTPEQAAAELLTIYGEKTTLSKISEAIARDRGTYHENGGFHPNLTVKSGVSSGEQVSTMDGIEHKPKVQEVSNKTGMTEECTTDRVSLGIKSSVYCKMCWRKQPKGMHWAQKKKNCKHSTKGCLQCKEPICKACWEEGYDKHRN